MKCRMISHMVRSASYWFVLPCCVASIVVLCVRAPAVDLVARGVNLFKWARRSASMLGQIQAATAAVPQVTGPPQTEEAGVS